MHSASTAIAQPRLMSERDLDAVLAVENAAYEFPWSRGNFIDSLAAGHVCRVLPDGQGRLLGYFVALPGVQEMHLLNLTVAPPDQARGLGRFLLGELMCLCREHGASQLWLEVRPSNQRAMRIYRRFGFEVCSVRRNYYPAARGAREDAIVMSLNVADSIGAANALD